MKRWRAAVVMLLVLPLSGCFMSLDELRATPPVRTAVVNSEDHVRLGQCVGERLITSGRMPYQIIPRADLGRTSIVGFVDQYQDKPMLDLQFVQRGVMPCTWRPAGGGPGPVRSTVM